jgi:hypothetical protein
MCGPYLPRAACVHHDALILQLLGQHTGVACLQGFADACMTAVQQQCQGWVVKAWEELGGMELGALLTPMWQPQNGSFLCCRVRHGCVLGEDAAGIWLC